MRKLLVTLTLASTIISCNAVAQDAATVIPSTVPPAPIGRAQPTARGFSSNSTATQAEQHRLAVFDAQQRELDEMLDKRLNACRC